MYRPLPKELTIKDSLIEGLGLFSKVKLKKNSFLGITHIRDELFESKYIRTPLGGFYNHSKNPNIMKMVSDVLPKFEFGEIMDPNKKIEPLKDGKNNRENLYYNLNEKPDAKYMFLIAIKDIEPGEELVASYTLYTFT
jgi:SET domain-containing protein|tara:strand:+ start:752 stop:1165 length:414 start_codon:yes stop_codon:yes gene_type:complete